MSSLLGPLVHLSPAVPAVVMASILGLATIDTWSFQGQGRALLLDSLARFSPDHRDRVIRHEAGHFLAALLLDIPVTGYTLSAWEAWRQGQVGAGGVSFDTTAIEAEIAGGTISTQTIDRLCTVWMAGVAAEDLVYGAAEGGADDRAKLVLLWQQLRRPLTEAQLKARWAALQAKALLETHRSAYDALVEAMQNRAPVQDCVAIVANLTATL
ncbi:ATP-dependent Zn protease [Microcoleus sp. FACHB-1515]|uniref:ATP-dependent Zn protease n=1 Tax=Cyanophyceae TaxID=3028117 RepID=UPI0018F0470F|nr:ATP-dependent Zn protease [Microcoleus sp. FACHB-1515]